VLLAPNPRKRVRMIVTERWYQEKAL
jgi:hypothetical protein